MKARIVLLGLLVTVPVLADAPANQYEAFVDTDFTITDHFTRLVWERPPASTTYPTAKDYAAAQLYCQARGNGSRLPSLRELLTLVDEEPHDEYDGSKRVTKMIDQSAFKRTPDGAFWTLTKRSDTELATVSFADGTTGSAQATGDQRNVRCVAAIP